MKHPGYSKAKNQYQQRANKKLSKKQKEAHKDTMKAFAERLKTLQK